MGKMKHKKHASKGAQAKGKTSPGEQQYDRIELSSAVARAACSGWVQNVGIAFLIVLATLVAAMWTSTQIKTAAIIFAITGTVAIWILAGTIIRYSSDGPQAHSVRFKVRTSILPKDRGAIFFVRYRSGFSGDTLVPLPIALIVAITNVRQVPVKLDAISVDVRKNGSGWVKLKHVPTLGQRVYWIYGDFEAAALLDFSKNGLDQLLNGKPIAPNNPVQGWIFFERPDSFIAEDGATIQWRFKAQDTEGNKYEATTEPDNVKNAVEGGAAIDANPAFLNFTGTKEDLSGLIISGGHDPVYPLSR
jgi:hypothetical protein